jgi:phosphatidylglycerophosphatase A
MIATSFGFGYLPVCPGTWGAILAIILWLPLYLWVSPMLTLAITAVAAVVFAVLGTWASSVSERYWGKDPVIACVDETVGQWISLLPVLAGGICPWWEILLSLALFRFFDIFKPLGIRAMERLPRGYGMMADDILAGIYSAVILLVLNHFIL